MKIKPLIQLRELIMKRIEERLETFRKSDFAGCVQMLKKALKYAIGECRR